MRVNKERRMKVMRMLVAAANFGRACPSNDAIAEALCIDSGTASNVIAALERQGLITVRRGNNRREVTIMASGLRTATVISKEKAKRAAPHGQSMITPKMLPAVTSDWRVLAHVEWDMGAVAGTKLFRDHPRGDSDRFPTLRLSRPVRHSAGVAAYDGAL